MWPRHRAEKPASKALKHTHTAAAVAACVCVWVCVWHLIERINSKAAACDRSLLITTHSNRTRPPLAPSAPACPLWNCCRNFEPQNIAAASVAVAASLHNCRTGPVHFTTCPFSWASTWPTEGTVGTSCAGKLAHKCLNNLVLQKVFALV